MENLLQSFTFKSISQQVKYLGHSYLTYRYILEGTCQSDTCLLTLTLILRFSDFCLIFAFNFISLQLLQLDFRYLVCRYALEGQWLSNSCHLTLTSISWFSDFENFTSKFYIQVHFSASKVARPFIFGL